jgi:hypothetical protein
MHKFKLGDKVVLKRSGQVAEVVRIFSYFYVPSYEVQFLESKICCETKELNLIPYTEQPSSSTNTMQDSNALYSFTKTDGSTGYATYLATNSAGEWVVEERGTGTIHTLPKDNFEEVVEYTIKVENIVKSGGGHFKGIKEGDVVVGDYIIDECSIYIVVELNTKSKSS